MIESVSTLTTRHAPLATRMRIAAHLRRACLARLGVAVPALGNNNANKNANAIKDVGLGGTRETRMVSPL